MTNDMDDSDDITKEEVLEQYAKMSKDCKKKLKHLIKEAKKLKKYSFDLFLDAENADGLVDDYAVDPSIDYGEGESEEDKKLKSKYKPQSDAILKISALSLHLAEALEEFLKSDGEKI